MTTRGQISYTAADASEAIAGLGIPDEAAESVATQAELSAEAAAREAADTAEAAARAAADLTNAQWKITITDADAAEQYKLKQVGVAENTAAIDWDATPAEVQAALEALTAIGAGNISVSDEHPSIGPANPGEYWIEYIGDLASSAQPGFEEGDQVDTDTVTVTVEELLTGGLDMSDAFAYDGIVTP